MSCCCTVLPTRQPLLDLRHLGGNKLMVLAGATPFNPLIVLLYYHPVTSNRYRFDRNSFLHLNWMRIFGSSVSQKGPVPRPWRQVRDMSASIHQSFSNQSTPDDVFGMRKNPIYRNSPDAPVNYIKPFSPYYQIIDYFRGLMKGTQGIIRRSSLANLSSSICRLRPAAFSHGSGDISRIN